MEIRHFCILAIGDLGECGVASLKSILSIKNVRLCVMADEAGFDYLDRSLPLLQINDSNCICRHKIPEVLNWVLSETYQTDEYVSFGQQKFFRLMHLKWQVIKEALLEYQANSVTFTDLDVYWRKQPEFEFKWNQRNGPVLAIQKDFTRDGRKFYCPGIMIWKCDNQALNILEEIQEFHKQLLLSNSSMPDDKALNQWLGFGDNLKYIVGLESTDFVIGHRLIFLICGVQGYNLENFTAFHANYAQGLRIKLRNLNYSRIQNREVLRRGSAIMILLRDRFLRRVQFLTVNQK